MLVVVLLLVMVVTCYDYFDCHECTYFYELVLVLLLGKTILIAKYGLFVTESHICYIASFTRYRTATGLTVAILSDSSFVSDLRPSSKKEGLRLDDESAAG